VERGAEEIRFSRQGDSLEVRYRIDGRVYRAGAPPGANATAVLDCIRRLAEIDAGGEGRVRIPFAGGEVILQVLAGADLAEGGIILRPD
jgi:type II secretory ATPase GspE/PulE/Tfp pilus assembly ATPase PilB-like protein